jgi:uncharacterized protein (DUF433 family)
MSEKLTQAIPLVRDEAGVLRITGSRVTLDSIVHQFNSGATAEQIQEDFPSLTLREVYAVIAYYLQNTDAVDDYLRGETHAAGEFRREAEALRDTGELRKRLRQRRAKATA